MKPSLVTLAVGCLAACGPGAPECSAVFSGNFAGASAGSCPRIERVDGTVLLRFQADAPSVNSVLEGSIDLGVRPAPGTFSSLTANGGWSALLKREPGCVYLAGKEAVPSGTFALTLTALEPPHGTLELLQYVHAFPMTDCGRGDVERVRLDF